MKPSFAAVGVRLAATPRAVGSARTFVSSALREWGLDDITDTAAVVTSELVTNAVRAVQTQIHFLPVHAPQASPLVEVQLQVSAGSLLIEVWDDSSEQPTVRRTADDAESGRGLALVEALSDCWGVCQSETQGKVVYAEICVEDAPAAKWPDFYHARSAEGAPPLMPGSAAPEGSRH
ncbi:ATP-binding protein [Streptomyces alboflavus]|uniref:ATP-binding protein n=1 Tax=Streptomyces alboflavus TaxID=67267 RepID=UPI00068C7D50|nr:ATP-binding protein [Streptomyces alboflavus]